jgi:hypothetical protein
MTGRVSRASVIEFPPSVDPTVADDIVIQHRVHRPKGIATPRVELESEGSMEHAIRGGV